MRLSGPSRGGRENLHASLICSTYEFSTVWNTFHKISFSVKLYLVIHKLHMYIKKKERKKKKKSMYIKYNAIF